MVVLNYTGGEINAKIVYYGPGVSGKTTNLEYIHEKAPDSAKGKMVSMKTQTDRTLFFDFLPLELGDINGYRTRFLLYTVPGQVYYNATRKLVLKGVDAVVFVADSSYGKLSENLESLRNLEQNLNEHGMSLDEIPWVIQYNKRDVPDAMPLAELDAKLNPLRVQTFEAVATLGTGVYETLHGISTRVYSVLKERLERDEAAGIGTPEAATQVVQPEQRPASPRPASAPAAARAGNPARSPVSRPAPSREPVAAAPAPRRAAPARPVPEAPVPDEDLIEREHEVDHAIDFALREAPARATPARPKPAPAPAVRPGPPARQTPEGEDLFEAIPDPFDADLGRVPSLDEASAASDTARDEGPDEFVTDPMRHARRELAAAKPAAAPEPVLQRPAPRPAPPASPATPRPKAVERSAPRRSAVSIPIVEELHATVYVSRAQLERASSVRVVVDVEVEDDE